MQLLQSNYAALYRSYKALHQEQAALQSRLDVSQRRMTQQFDAAAAALHQRTAELQSVTVETTLAEQRERRDIAEQYREHLAQLLAGIHFLAGVLAQERGLAADPRWRELTDLVTTALRTALNIGGTLAPHVLSQEELLPALHWLTTWMQERHGFTVELRTPATLPTTPEPTNLLLFHAIRHLLVNAATYAQVKTARVSLAQRDGWLRVTVNDAGVGFDPASIVHRTGGGRVGLASIRQMLEYLGGKLEIASAPGRGSRFTLTVPLQPTAPASA